MFLAKLFENKRDILLCRKIGPDVLLITKSIRIYSGFEIRSSCLEDVDFPKGKLMTRTLFLLAHFIVVTLVISIHGFQNSWGEGN